MLQEALLGNMVLTGGSTQFPNFKARLYVCWRPVRVLEAG